MSSGSAGRAAPEPPVTRRQGGPMSTGSPGEERNDVPILMYHEIADRTETASRLAVSPDAFAGQLARLHAGGFTTLTARELATALAGGTDALPPKPVVLTFDDGFADFHSRPLPLLRRYGFTATVFVTTGWICDAAQRSEERRVGKECRSRWSP